MEGSGAPVCTAAGAEVRVLISNDATFVTSVAFGNAHHKIVNCLRMLLMGMGKVV